MQILMSMMMQAYEGVMGRFGIQDRNTEGYSGEDFQKRQGRKGGRCNLKKWWK